MKRVKKHYMSIWGLVLALAVILSPAEARGDLFWQPVFPTNSGPDAFTVAQDLSVVIADEGSGQMSFTFFNDASIASSITEIYFDDGILGPPTVSYSGGVYFVEEADPGVLPGGNNLVPPFVATELLSAESADPTKPGESTAWGVDHSGEWVKLVYGGDLAAVMADLYDGDLRIGLHVRGIGTASTSDAFILVPLPGAVLLGVLGLGVVGWKLRKSA